MTEHALLATEGAIMQLSHAASLEQQYKEVVRQCVRDGYTETLCFRDL